MSREKKNRREIIILTIGLILYAVVFSAGYMAGRREEAEVRAGEGVYADGYADGLSDGEIVAQEAAYASGYADGHLEAQHHSDMFDELMRQAYQATDGKGDGFYTDDSGNMFMEETAPNGQKVRVPFEP